MQSALEGLGWRAAGKGLRAPCRLCGSEAVISQHSRRADPKHTGSFLLPGGYRLGYAGFLPMLPPPSPLLSPGLAVCFDWDLVFLSQLKKRIWVL